jgi:large subunit ribosomal protein L15
LIRLDTLSPAPGSRKEKKRVGRGDGSRKGSFSGRGCKGQKGRAGFRMKPGFEGGQLPIIKRLPSQRGFNNIFKTEYDVVNVAQLNVFESGTEVDIITLMTAGLVKTGQKLVKILGDGEIDRPLTVKADKFTAAAKAKIEAAGGKAEEVVYEAPAD